MKRLLLSLICCTPLLLSPSVSLSVDLTGPSSETFLDFEQYGPISPTETLWAISSKLRPDSSVSVQQTMVAIYKSNPYAFFNGDINKIIPESIINVPSLEFVEEQTDKEAIDLINKYSSKNKKVTKKEPVKALPKAVEKTVKDPIVDKTDPTIVAENELNKQKVAAAELNATELHAEIKLLNEQFIVATEAMQVLKLKLQPLSDEISLLTEQLAEEALIQDKLQQIIDDYRAQLDAVELPPYSGEGMINEILRLITSSVTNLMIVIISPVLLLLLVFVVISRIRSKRQIAEHEQELAESTAILMEESGQFDELLTEDFSENEDPELDFSENEDIIEPESIDIDDLDDLTLPDEEPIIDLTYNDTGDVALNEEDELLTSEDDPFGIDGLTDDEELISSVDLDDDEVENNEDDPFGIGALVDDEELISAVDLDEGVEEKGEDDPFGIAALTDDEDLTASVELNDDKPISDAEQADLDLAAEWEAQVLAESDTTSVKENDVVDQGESESDLATTSSAVENDTLPVVASPDIEGDTDTSRGEMDTLSEIDEPSESNIEDLEGITESAELEIPGIDEDESAPLDIPAIDEDESAPLDITDLADLDEALTEPAELDIPAIDEDESEALDIADLADLEDEALAEPADLDISAIDEDESEALDIADLEDEALAEPADLDISAIDEGESEPLDITDLEEEALAETADLDIPDIDEDESEPLDIADEALTETAELDIPDIDEDESEPLDITDLADEALTETAELDIPVRDEDESEALDITDLEEEALAETADLDIPDIDEDESEALAETAELDIPARDEDESEPLDITDLEEEALAEPTELDIPARDEDESAPLDITDLADLEEEALAEPAELDISAIDEGESEALDIADLTDLEDEALTETAELDIPAIDEDESAPLDIADLADLEDEALTETADLDIPDIDEDESASLDLREPETEETVEERDVDKAHDLLAQQLSNVAFNEEVPLPKVDRVAQEDFIDIETLLENSDLNDKDEPYSELELDLGLEEFPDVVDLQESVDIDDDENGIGAQLDLARAYLEIDDQAGAKEILMSVVEDSNGKQRAEIDKLLSRLD